jgi:hypothetical protein
MRIKNVENLSILKDYGFSEINKEEAIENEDYVASCFSFEFNLGHSRRGQFYSLFVGSDGVIHVYASKPDGDGSSVVIGDVLFRMIQDGVITI